MSIRERIKQLRFERGLGPEQLAKAAGVSRTALYHLESGHVASVRAGTLKKLADALGVDVGAFADAVAPAIAADPSDVAGDQAVISFRLAGRRFELRSWPEPDSTEPGQDPGDLAVIPPLAVPGGVAGPVEPAGDLPLG